MSTFIKFPEISEVSFELKTENEPDPPSFDDPEMNAEICRRRDSGDRWAWCTVIVYARWNECHGTAMLGECSYKSEEDFLEDCAQYDAMMCDAYNDLLERLEKMAKRLEPLVTRESFDEWLVSKVQEE